MITIWTYDWVPPQPRGYVRDLRLRWACEEGGLGYAAQGDGVPPILSIEELGITDPNMAAYVEARLDPQPLGTMIQPLAFNPATVAKVPRTFIQTSEAFAQEAEKARADGRFDMLAIEGAGHDVMLTQPQALADMLADLT